MEIKRILSRRWFADRHSYDLVYEWEDNLMEFLEVPMSYSPAFEVSSSTSSLYRLAFKVLDLVAYPFVTRQPALSFEMNASFRKGIAMNRSNIVPWVIDFYIRKESELQEFYKRFSKHPIVLISSREAYDYLIEKGCPLNIAHLALSVSDSLRLDDDSEFDKKYDVALVGRQNPVLLSWLNQYSSSKNLSIVSCRQENGHFNYYTSDGEFVCDADNREHYLDLLKKTKVGLYSTQGMDGDVRSSRVSGFSQVTPRFLEYLVTGNHVLARYPQNSDVQYYEMERICKNLNSYEEFENAMNEALSHPVSIKLYSDYLNQHYTSVRAKQLIEILKTI